MRIDLVSGLVYGFIRNDKEQIHKAFAQCLANEKEGTVKTRIRCMYDEYKCREGMAVVEKLDSSIQGLISPPCRDISFDDLFLSEDVKDDTAKLLLEWENRDYLIENGLLPSNKILLEGPPGNGKTSYAIALAKKLNLTLLTTSSSLVLNSHMGQSEKNVAMLFNKIPDKCVLFFDEFESLASGREDPGFDSGGASRAWNSIVTALLVGMENIRSSVLFLAATNRSDLLDKAVLRRFDMRLDFPNPTPKEKEDYIQSYLDKYGIVLGTGKTQRKLDKAVSYSAMETVLRKRHKEIVLKRLLAEKANGLLMD